jgi:hypothetical protein
MRFGGTLSLEEYRQARPAAFCIPVVSSDGVTVYNVRMLPSGGMSCPCPDYWYRRGPAGEDCKHIALVRRLCRAC